MIYLIFLIFDVLYFLWFSVLYNVPTFFEIKTTIDHENDSTYMITGTSLRQNFLYFSIYKVYGKMAIDVVSYIMIIVLNSFIVVKIVKSSKFRKKIAKNEGTATKTITNETFLDGRDVSRKSSGNSTNSPNNSPDKSTVLNTENKVRREMGM